MDYQDKYIKYKTKYLELKNQTGGSGKRITKTSWDARVKARAKELAGMTNTKSYIPKSKLSTRNKIYYPHDNGGRPFKIIVNNQGIDIYEYTCYDEEKDEVTYSNLVKHITNFLGYWDGFDSSPYKMHGNSLLIQLTKKNYIHIGCDIYMFSSESEIIDFVSPVGNSDVPYPIAYDRTNIYFMLDHVFNKISEFEIKPSVQTAEDIYGEFYRHIGGTKMKKFKMIYDREKKYPKC